MILDSLRAKIAERFSPVDESERARITREKAKREADLDFQVPVERRRRLRARKASLARRQRKGQRAYYREQIAIARSTPQPTRRQIIEARQEEAAIQAALEAEVAARQADQHAQRDVDPSIQEELDRLAVDIEAAPVVRTPTRRERREATRGDRRAVRDARRLAARA